MSVRHKISRQGLELIKGFEGLRQSAAKLPDGRWTIGYGHTLSAREGATVSAQDAEALLLYDLMPVMKAVNEAVNVPISASQFDALVSFAFNIGLDLFRVSNVLAFTNEGRFAEAGAALDGWRTAEFNGQTYVLEPLVRRREAEKALFLSGIEAAGVVEPQGHGPEVTAPVEAQVAEPVAELELTVEPEAPSAPETIEAAQTEDKRKAETEAALMRFYSPYGSRPAVQLVPQRPAEETPVAPVVTPQPVEVEPVDVAAESVPEIPEPVIAPVVAAVPVAPVPVAPVPVASVSVPERHWREVLQRPLPADRPAPEPLVESFTPPEPSFAEPSFAEPFQVPAAHSERPQAGIFQEGLSEENEALFATHRPTQLAAAPVDPIAEEWGAEDRIALTLDEVREVDEGWLSKFLSTLKLIIFSCLGMVCIGGGVAAYLKGRNSEVMRQGFVDDYTKLSGIMAAFGVLLVFVAIWLILRRLAGLKN